MVSDKIAEYAKKMREKKLAEVGEGNCGLEKAHTFDRFPRLSPTPAHPSLGKHRILAAAHFFPAQWVVDQDISPESLGCL